MGGGAFCLSRRSREEEEEGGQGQTGLLLGGGER